MLGPDHLLDLLKADPVLSWAVYLYLHGPEANATVGPPLPANFLHSCYSFCYHQHLATLPCLPFGAFFSSCSVASKSKQPFKSSSCWKFPTFLLQLQPWSFIEVRILVYMGVACPFNQNHKRNETRFSKREELCKGAIICPISDHTIQTKFFLQLT